MSRRQHYVATGLVEATLAEARIASPLNGVAEQGHTAWEGPEALSAVAGGGDKT